MVKKSSQDNETKNVENLVNKSLTTFIQTTKELDYFKIFQRAQI
jgi:hypothetical protein